MICSDEELLWASSNRRGYMCSKSRSGRQDPTDGIIRPVYPWRHYWWRGNPPAKHESPFSAHTCTRTPHAVMTGSGSAAHKAEEELVSCQPTSLLLYDGS